MRWFFKKKGINFRDNDMEIKVRKMDKDLKLEIV